MTAGPSAGRALVLDSAPAGLALAAGESVEILLPETPSTGYLWEARPSTPDLAITVLAFDPGGDAPGAAGWRRFRVSALAPGRHRAQFELRRSWEEGSPLDRRELEVNVSG